MTDTCGLPARPLISAVGDWIERVFNRQKPLSPRLIGPVAI